MHRLFLHRGLQGASARWIVGTFTLAALAWLAVLAGLLAIANRVHDDVPMLLAVKLPLFRSKPGFIFCRHSPPVYHVGPTLPAQTTSKPPRRAAQIAPYRGHTP